jgi:hypothetical protein
MKNKISFLIIALVLSTTSSPLAIAKINLKKSQSLSKKVSKEDVKKLKFPQKAQEKSEQASKKQAANKSSEEAKTVKEPREKSSKAAKAKNAKEAKAEAHKLKDEVKEWDQKKKHMDPLQLKDLIEENHRLKTQKRDLDTYIQELELRIKVQEQKTEQLNKVHAEQDRLYIAGTGNTPRDIEDLAPGSYTIDQASGQVFIDGILDNRYGVDKETGKPFIKGIIFKVQVSADKDIDLTDVLSDDSHHTTLEQEKADNLNKYTIGHFRNYWEADKLKKGLRSMGVRWAWIVPYKDGKRVLLKEVLDIVISAKKK